MDAELLVKNFTQRFNSVPIIVRAPGRINLIGEHTDYNQGFVMPAAIDRAIYFAIALNNRAEIHLVAYDEQEDSVSIGIDSIKPVEKSWANYLLGVIAQFQNHGIAVTGFDCVFGGDIPHGAGLSSSAALCCGMAYALNHLFNSGLDQLTLAQIGQSAEHTYAGVQLDCRSLAYQYLTFDTKVCHIVLCNTGVKHSLASTEYNKRREECERGVTVLQQYYPEVASLRDATLEQLHLHADELGTIVYRRCHYVVQENSRVLAAAQALKEADLKALGQLMYASHAGLRDEYEVSCRELDVLVEAAQTLPGVYGARMMGGGFGGCTINLVVPDKVAEFEEAMKKAYKQELCLTLETYHITLVDGVSLVGL
jgi:galactokinase